MATAATLRQRAAPDVSLLDLLRRRFALVPNHRRALDDRVVGEWYDVEAGRMVPVTDHEVAVRYLGAIYGDRIHQTWVWTAADGTTVHGQLFARNDGTGPKPGIIFVHGGPPRQMLLGWHYGRRSPGTGPAWPRRAGGTCRRSAPSSRCRAPRPTGSTAAAATSAGPGTPSGSAGRGRGDGRITLSGPRRSSSTPSCGRRRRRPPRPLPGRGLGRVTPVLVLQQES